jgi:TonB family protein
LVQVKVEKNWQVPAGLSLGDKGNQATVSFWVDRQGNLLAKPEVVKEAADRELGESGVRAIMLAAPLPPLPDDFKSMEQEVIYVFTLAE